LLQRTLSQFDDPFAVLLYTAWLIAVNNNRQRSSRSKRRR